MRHKYKGRKLGSNWSHTKAMKRSLVQALFLNDRIKTVDSRAKEIRPEVDKIVTWAKRGDLHSRRLAIAALGGDKELAREVFEKVDQGMFKDRQGGYSRIMKLGPRKGDGASMVIMELVTETCIPKAEKKAQAAKASSKATPKKKAPSKSQVKKAEEDVKEQEEKNVEDKENVIQEMKDSVEAFEEEFAKDVQEKGEEQLKEEKAEASKNAKAEEEVREEQFKEEAESALEAEGKAPENEVPQNEEKA